MNAAALQRLEIEQRLRAGARARRARGALPAEARPAHAAGRRLRGARALARSGARARRPAEFIPVAEQSGLIVAIGRCVLEQACRQIARWEQDGAPPGVARLGERVGAPVRERRPRRDVRRVLAETGARPAARARDHREHGDARREVGDRARSTSCARSASRSSLDDFGTGYSSLSYLRSLPVDTLKIDMAFVRNIAHNEEDAALTAAIVSMGKARGLRVIAEGVETAEQRRLLTSFGCDEIQGIPSTCGAGIRGRRIRRTPSPLRMATGPRSHPQRITSAAVQGRRRGRKEAARARRPSFPATFSGQFPLFPATGSGPSTCANRPRQTLVRGQGRFVPSKRSEG